MVSGQFTLVTHSLPSQNAYNSRVKRRELQVTYEGKSYPFTLGVIVESLQGAGVTTSEAIEIARALEKHYQSGRSKRIKLEKLVKKLGKAVASEIGDETAERFRTQTPPFVPLTVISEDKGRAFSRRRLVESLDKLELKLKEAYALAAQVEQALRQRGYERVTVRELTHLVALALEASHGRELRLRYELEAGQAGDVQLIEPSGDVVPFSRGLLAQSLMSVGVGPELAPALSRQLEDVLWHKGLTRVTRATLRQEVEALLLSEMGEVFAQRYDLMRKVRAWERPFIILIGGAPGVGKSTLAYELAYRLGIRRIVSSDAVRQALRSLISPQLSPSLHESSFTAWRAGLLPGESASVPKRKRVVRGFQTQVQQLGNALMGILERSVLEGGSTIVEGVHVVPGTLPLSELSGATVLELILSVEDEDAHRANFSRRGEQSAQRRAEERYAEHFSEIRMLHDFSVKRAREEGVATLQMADLESSTDRAVELVLSAALFEIEDRVETEPKSTSSKENTEPEELAPEEAVASK